MNRAIVFALLAVLASPAAAKAKKAPAFTFPIEAFSANEEIANWLLAYDFAAWKASDLVMEEPEEQLKKLGPHWFCFKDAQGWHALFGRYDKDAGVYHQQRHYVRQDDEMVRTTDEVDPALALRYSRALDVALAEQPPEIKDLPAKLNHYVRPTEDGKLEVWWLPTMQPDGTVVFGGDIHYVLDGEGAKILDRHSNVKEFRAAKAEPTVDLEVDRRENDVPSVGDIFLIQQFRGAFKSVTVWTRCYLTQFLDSEGKELAWLHAQKQTPECEGKPAKRKKGG